MQWVLNVYTRTLYNIINSSVPDSLSFVTVDC